jgi:hypothetical protein
VRSGFFNTELQRYRDLFSSALRVFQHRVTEVQSFLPVRSEFFNTELQRYRFFLPVCSEFFNTETQRYRDFFASVLRVFQHRVTEVQSFFASALRVFQHRDTKVQRFFCNCALNFSTQRHKDTEIFLQLRSKFFNTEVQRIKSLYLCIFVLIFSYLSPLTSHFFLQRFNLCISVSLC